MENPKPFDLSDSKIVLAKDFWKNRPPNVHLNRTSLYFDNKAWKDINTQKKFQAYIFGKKRLKVYFAQKCIKSEKSGSYIKIYEIELA